MTSMYTSITRSQLFVLDQDQALDFYVNKLGLDVSAGGGWLSIATTDAQAAFETLKSRGVDITDEPTPKPYGIDFGIRDPFGNPIRIGQIFDPGL